VTRVLFDLATPKAVRFFAPMMSELRARGVEATAVARDYPEVHGLVERFALDAPSFGRFGGAEPRDKSVASLGRTLELVEHLAKDPPDALVCLNVPDSSRAAYALGVPLVAFCDLPEAEHTARLSLPLAARVLAPDVIEPGEILRFGVSPDRLQRYASLDPLLWLERDPPDPEALELAGLDPDRPVVVARETEWQSSYVREDLVGPAVAELRRRHPDWQIVTVPRYEAHPCVDVPSLLARADLLVGGGGTMCIEAAALGVPVLASRARRVAYMEWLFARGLATRCASAAEIIARAGALVAGRASPEAEARRRRARRAFEAMAFPLDAVLDGILSAAAGDAAPAARAEDGEPAARAEGGEPEARAEGGEPEARLHAQALVDPGARVGARTRVWAFAHVAAGARVGADCNLCDHTFVEDGVVVGDRVTVKSGVHLWRGVTVEDDVFIGPGAAFSNDRRPRSRRTPPAFEATRLRRGCSIGANATLLPGVEVGAFAMVGAGAVVCDDVAPHAVVRGSPARRTGWACRCGGPLGDAPRSARCPECGAAWRVTDDGVEPAP